MVMKWAYENMAHLGHSKVHNYIFGVYNVTIFFNRCFLLQVDNLNLATNLEN